MEEKWRLVKGFKDYAVSNCGRVKSLKGVPHILKPRLNSKGYFIVLLYKEGLGWNKTIHRLVANAFIPNPENKPCIDHMDTNIRNNCVKNLRWCTHKENSNNPLTLQKRKILSDGKHKSMNDPVYNSETGRTFINCHAAARFFDIPAVGIVSNCKGKVPHVSGYHFCFAENRKKIVQKKVPNYNIS